MFGGAIVFAQWIHLSLAAIVDAHLRRCCVALYRSVAAISVPHSSTSNSIWHRIRRNSPRLECGARRRVWAGRPSALELPSPVNAIRTQCQSTRQAATGRILRQTIEQSVAILNRAPERNSKSVGRQIDRV